MQSEDNNATNNATDGDKKRVGDKEVIRLFNLGLNEGIDVQNETEQQQQGEELKCPEFPTSKVCIRKLNLSRVEHSLTPSFALFNL